MPRLSPLRPGPSSPRHCFCGTDTAPARNGMKKNEAQVLGCAAFKCLPHPACLPPFLEGNFPRPPPKFSGK